VAAPGEITTVYGHGWPGRALVSSNWPRSRNSWLSTTTSTS